jgi:glycerol-3-phosphate acyltransferase PlsY
MNTEVGIGLLAAITGYLLGSISFARIISALAEPGRRIERLEIPLADSDLTFESDAVSATSVWQQLGARFGCLTSILDMLKAAIPTLAFRLIYPDASHYLFAAGMAVVGHIWPLYYRFKGGRGMSPILGGMLVIDWLGVLISHVAASLVSIPKKNIPIAIGGGLALMIPWLAFRTREIGPVLYAIVMNGLFWYAIRPEIRSYTKLKNTGKLDSLTNSEAWRLAKDSDFEASPVAFRRLRQWLKPEKKPSDSKEPSD